MADFITGIMTQQGPKKIDYAAIGNRPASDTTLSQSGAFADAKAVGDELQDIKATKADKSYVETAINGIQGDKTLSIDGAFADAKTVGDKLSEKADKSYVDDQTSVLTATEADNGKILRVMDGVASWQSASSALDATPEDNGKILTVVDGTSQWQSLAGTFIADEQDNGKILTVVNGNTAWKSTSETLDASSAADGQFLRVRNGVIVWESVPDAEESGF